MKDVVNMTVQLEAAEVNLIVLDSEWIDTTTPNGKFFFLSMALMDELKREIIVQNTNEGLQAARARGRKGGRPPVDKAVLKTAMTMYESKNHTIKEIVNITGISQGRLYKEVNAQKIFELG
jgi:Site-specific recombinases, DNA invertase Pin homologs